MNHVISENSCGWDREYSTKIVAEQECPDMRIGLRDCHKMVGHAALWWKSAPALPSEVCGIIGGFEAEDTVIAASLLMEAEKILRNAGCTIAVGPMNGNTWRKHRFVSWSDGSPWFVLEPRAPSEHIAWWSASGYKRLAAYSSSRMIVDGATTTPPAVAERLRMNGIVTRGVLLSQLKEELTAIHDVCLESFRENFLYTALEKNEFVARYEALAPIMSPEFVRVAECYGKICGFIFSMPDPQPVCDTRGAELIVKTLAVIPSRMYAGMGSVLVDEVHQAAARSGIKSAVHALQREDNCSRRITGRHKGSVFRRYEILSKKLIS